jgi:hypothetical protein
MAYHPWMWIFVQPIDYYNSCRWSIPRKLLISIKTSSLNHVIIAFTYTMPRFILVGYTSWCDNLAAFYTPCCKFFLITSSTILKNKPWWWWNEIQFDIEFRINKYLQFPVLEEWSSAKTYNFIAIHFVVWQFITSENLPWFQ